MGRRRNRHLPPFETEITHLGPKGQGVGATPTGQVVLVRGAVPGSRIRVRPSGKRKGVWSGRIEARIRPSADAVTPQCEVFGLCGGCTLQTLSVEAQRRHKAAWVSAEVAQGWERDGLPESVSVHPLRAAPVAYGYRNKLELSFGSSRYLSEADHAAGLPIDGRFLGMHAPGRFDRVVDTERCHLGDEGMGELLRIVREHALVDDAPPCWNAREHVGFWRHLMLRMGANTGQRLVVLFTADPTPWPDADARIEALAEALLAAPLSDGSSVTGVHWCVNTGVADVARGALRRQWGASGLQEVLSGVRFELAPDAFFQTHTAAAEVLITTISEALGPVSGTLLDLYCGTGSIGLCLAGQAQRLIGIEEVESAVHNARENARLNGVEAEFRAAKVEDALDWVGGGADVHIVVDPPRAGLHPKVARKLAETDARVLVYVACHPRSLGRDAALLGPGWRMTDLWSVDLFPQTGHTEAVARFERVP